MRWKAYPEYKLSGIEWLGEIPEGWEIRRLKKVTLFGYGDSLNTVERVLGDYDVYGSNGVVGQHDKANTRGPCLIVGRKGSFGKVAYSERPCFAIDTTYFIDERLTKNNLRWLYYCLQWLHLDSFTKDSAVPGLSREDAYENPMPFCPIQKQCAIAAFLDHETARIDALIEKKQRQIELLQEKRSALISHAVTKGLNPNVKMKDSGIEWLGEVPEGWEVIRVKALEANSSNVVQTGPFGAQLHADDYVEKGVPLILISNIGDMRIDDTNIPMVSHQDAKRLSMYQVKTGDIVFSRVGSIGRVAACTERENGWLISGQMLRLRIHNPLLNKRFAAYAFACSSVLTFVELQSVGSTRESINTNILRNMPLPIPSPNEQRAIAAFLDRESARIDTVIEKVKVSISLLREYRTALISAAVTGKIDVREEASNACG